MLKDPKHILQKIGEAQAGRWIRFTSPQEISALQPALRNYIYEAIQVEESGKKVPLKKPSEYVVPEELQVRLNAAPALKAAFEAALTELLRRRGSDPLLVDGMFQLAMWKLSFLEEIDPAMSATFSQEEDRRLDFADPETYMILATAGEIQFRKVETPDLRDRLLPYWLLNDLQRQAGSVVDLDLLNQITENAARSVPVWHGALRSWALSYGEISAPALQ